MADRPSLDGIRAKLDRAHEHLVLLDAETAAFFDTEPIEVVGEYDAQTTEYVFRAKVRREPPPRLGVILGDFAHNLRSALDHLVYQSILLAGIDTRARDRHRFPILTRCDADFRRRQPTSLRRVLASHAALIKRAQPYHAPNPDDHALAILNWLANSDKHQLVHPTIGVMRLDQEPDLHFVPNRDAGSILWHRGFWNRHFVDGADLIRLGLASVGAQPKVEMHGEITGDVAFGDRALRGTALPEIEAYVRGLIDLFAGDFPT